MHWTPTVPPYLMVTMKDQHFNNLDHHLLEAGETGPETRPVVLPLAEVLSAYPTRAGAAMRTTQHLRLQPFSN